MRVDLNKHESVTVTLRSKGGGIIWIRSYGERSPHLVACLCRHQMSGSHLDALLCHAVELTGRASTSTADYCHMISWTGS